jgi:hypothetical protein
MSLLYYSADKGVALASDPLSLGGDPEHQEDLCPDPLEVDELGTYFIRSFGSESESWLASSKFVKKDVIYPGGLRELSFFNRVGLTRIGPISILITSRKMSSETYHSMLHFVCDNFANLIFNSKGLSGENYRKDEPGSDIPYIESLFLERFLLGSPPQIDMISSLILSEPHRKFMRHSLMKPLEMITSPGPSMIEDIVAATNYLVSIDPARSIAQTHLARRFHEKTDGFFFPSDVWCEEKSHTFDTPENRFIKFVLEQLANRLTILMEVLVRRGGGYLNPELASKLSILDRKLSSFLSAPLWKDVGRMTYVPASSQVLQKRDGYRHLYHLYCLLYQLSRAQFHSMDFQNIMETKDIPTLYEYWCFFAVKQILDLRSRVLSASPIVQSDPLEQKLVTGLLVSYDNGLTLWFQKSYKARLESYSHQLVPDIVIQSSNREIVFDAKFKGKVEDNEIDSYHFHDIDKMHAYRDALRDVRGAFILYPGNDLDMFMAHEGRTAYDGVGAFPLNPGEDGKLDQQNTTEVEQIIDAFLKED